MKEIKTASYLNKLALDQYPSYPPGVNERDIADNAGNGQPDTLVYGDFISDPLEVVINGAEFNEWAEVKLFPEKEVGVNIYFNYTYNKATREMEYKVKKVLDNSGRDITKYDLGDYSDNDIRVAIYNDVRDRGEDVEEDEGW
jgi:hypothetical protein